MKRIYDLCDMVTLRRRQRHYGVELFSPDNAFSIDMMRAGVSVYVAQTCIIDHYLDTNDRELMSCNLKYEHLHDRIIAALISILNHGEIR